MHTHGDGPGREVVAAAAPGRERPHRRCELVQRLGVDGQGRRAGGREDLAVPRPGGVGPHAYIRSGAETPSIPRPLARVWRAAAQSQRRAMVIGSSSASACGSTRHTS
mgnify:CR=1 FL=1